MTVEVEKCIRVWRLRLAGLWFMLSALSACAILFFYLIDAITIKQGFDWLIPHIAPVLGMTGAVNLLAPTGAAKDEDLESLRFIFRLSVSITLFYFMIIVAALGMSYWKAITVDPENTEGMTTTVALLSEFNILIGFMQGLVASVMGFFFAKT